MIVASPRNSSIGPEEWVNLPDSEWVAVHVPRFRDVRPRYVLFKKFLQDVLDKACETRAPYAIVQARTKSIPSFAEKILRKRRSFVDPAEPLPPDPLLRLTDLCAARVITQTSEQVNSICKFIENAFVLLQTKTPV